MVRMKEYFRRHRAVAVLVGIVLLLTTIPVLEASFVVGDTWQGITPTFSDETFYLARIQTIVKGHITEGNPYFMEHSDGPPLVIFAGAWLNALPQLAGLSFNTSLLINFVLWSLLFAASLYWLFRELWTPPWVAVFGTVFLYVQSYQHIWRPVNLQTVYPFYFLFYVALLRLIREQSRKNIILVGLATGATFYLYAYLWQAIVITLGLLTLYALIKKNMPLLKATLLSSLLGGVIGLPVPLYALWLSHTSPYFWESVGRLGLVNTHLPMAEVIYSGGWIGIVLALFAILLWRTQALREDREFILFGSFLAITGFGLWIMQGSNFITGKLLETGEHVRLLIQPWLVFSVISIGVFLWRHRSHLSKKLQVLSVIIIVLLSVVSVQSAYQRFSPFLITQVDREGWKTAQLYAKPFAWLQNAEKDPVVVWSNPEDLLTVYLPIFTKHFTLYTWPGMMELVPEGEIHERYLISHYFNNLTTADLKNDIARYLGRQDAAHKAKTIEREIKICRIVFVFDKNKDCGIVPTPQSLLGDQFFTDLENKFQTDIKPNIKAYLKKYHVAYILKDKVLDSEYHPEKLGAKLVYTDDRYEIYHL